MNHTEQKRAAKEFAMKWEGIGYEKGDSARFWLSLLQDVYDVEKPTDFILFEERIKLDHTSFIDGYIPSTNVLIEQKSIDKDLGKAIRQSDGSLLTPFQQAKRYSSELPYSERPRWVVISNFKKFCIYDMEKPTGDPEILYLKDLEDEYYRLSFLRNVDDKNIQKAKEVSIKAGELVGILYDALLKEYQNPEDEETLKDLNTLSVRLVFCFYAEDSGLFGRQRMFHDYLEKHKGIHFRGALIKLFRVLNQKPEERDPYLDDDLSAFPYVNGGLFEKKDLEVPRLNDEIIDIILNQASSNFNWSNISPTIFGGVFESTLNPQTRRSGGMHYTSIENIHKVIDPLFMNELNKEFEKLQLLKTHNIRERRLEEFQEKIASLRFLDPAAGSGNFLTETYISLRRLENEVIKNIHGIQVVLGDIVNPIKVSINQFYGIEINDFAVTVAKTALWIAESQMIQETKDIIHTNIDFLPIKSQAKIVEANALRIDWNTVIEKNKLTYIIGNPPFIGMKEMSDENKEDMKISIPIKTFKQLDYVASWYFKAAAYMLDTDIEAAFVSSNSIAQGEQAITIWEPLLSKKKLIINFAHRSFIWNSETKNVAKVHCVIIGFSYKSRLDKLIFDNSIAQKTKNINQYLLPTENIFIKKTGKPILGYEKMTKGAQLIDGNNFKVGGQKEYEEVIAKYPDVKKYIRRYFNAQNLINNGATVYVLYLEDCPPEIINNNKYIKDKVRGVYEYRANNPSPSTNKLKDSPTKYFQPQVPMDKSIVVPVVSSINRKYIPISFMPEGMVYSNALFFIDNASIYTFGILTSNVHISWIKTVCGRLKSDYRYSNTLGYNTFPWPTVTTEQKSEIEDTANMIIKARQLYPNASLADLYDELSMPVELRTAHQENDKAVMEAYNFDWRTMTESDCVAELLQIYENN
ncbi:MAG: class I SAM-dependent DNA methyltransferase [Carnobacterium sp.]|nr:class I SAM-dependent DNA methyltransferase [Carnobacterium sp.]